MPNAVGLPSKTKMLDLQKFELAAMDFYKILWKFIFTFFQGHIQVNFSGDPD